VADPTSPRTRQMAGAQEFVAAADFDISRCISAIARHKLLIATTVALSLALCSLVIASVRPLYRADAQIMIDPRQANVVDVKSVVPGFDLSSNSSAAIIATQVGILRSEPVMREVIERLNLANDPRLLRQGRFSVLRWSFLADYIDPLFTRLEPTAQEEAPHSPSIGNPPSTESGVFNGRERALSAAVARYQRDLRIDNDGRSFLITVEFKSTDKALAALIANTHAEVYLAQQQRERTRLEQTANKWLADQNAQLKSNLVRAEQAVQQYRQQHRLVALPGGDGRPTSELQQQLVELNTQLALARADGAQKQAQADALRRILTSPDPAEAMQSVSQIVSSPLIDQLRAQETEVLRREAELTTQYGDKYPAVLQIRGELGSVRTKIRQEIERIAGSVERDAGVALAREASLRDNLARLGRDTDAQNALEIKLRGLQQEADAARDVYQNFLNRQKEIAAQLGLQQPDARVIATASVPLRPYFPNVMLLLSLTAAASSLGGVGLSLLVDRYSKGFRSSGQVEQHCGVPVLGTLSTLKPPLFRRAQPADCVVERPSSVFAEQIHEIRFACQNAVGRDGGKTLLVTSCLPNEGKSVLALSLARSLALSGYRVLLCDCDLRRSSVGRLIADREEAQGFADYLRGSCAWEDVVRKDPLSGLHYTRPSKPPRSPGALLVPDNIAAGFAVLRQRYQYIVVDSPPLAPVADARALAPVADCCIFVVRWIKTPRALVEALLQRLVSSSSAPVGVVLTRVDMNSTARFETRDVEKYYRKYRKYYANG